MTKKIELWTRPASSDYYTYGIPGDGSELALCKKFIDDFFPEVNTDNPIILTLSDKPIEGERALVWIQRDGNYIDWGQDIGDIGMPVYFSLQRELEAFLSIEKPDDAVKIWVKVVNAKTEKV